MAKIWKIELKPPKPKKQYEGKDKSMDKTIQEEVERREKIKRISPRPKPKRKEK